MMRNWSQTITPIKSNTVRYAGHVENEKCAVLVGKPEGKCHLRDLDVDGRHINMDLEEMVCEGMDMN
jgi:hypothetical protein